VNHRRCKYANQSFNGSGFYSQIAKIKSVEKFNAKISHMINTNLNGTTELPKKLLSFEGIPIILKPDL
jgi:hypothetical protein